MSKVVIFGTGEYGRVAHRYLDADSPHEVVAFTVNRDYIGRDVVNGVPVVPFEEISNTHPPGETSMLVAAGFSEVNAVRTRIYEECKGRGYEFISYVSSRAYVFDDVPIGENTFVFEASVVQPGAAIGNNCVLWTGNHIAHDTTIGDHCFFASDVSVSGNCTIGHSCFVGVDATLRDGVTVAPRTVIGAGALIMHDTAEGDVYSVRGTQPNELKSWDLKTL